jgi:hypothetical protein
VQVHDVRVADARRRASFLAHAIDERGTLLRRDRQIVAQQLERDGSIEHRIVRQQDASHRSAPEQANDLVASDASRQGGLEGIHP